MGCISSKVIARSISFHKERKQRSRRTANAIPLLEDIINSANGSDQYLALVCAANAVSNKLHCRSFSSNTSKLAIELVTSGTTEKLEMSTTLDQEGGKQIDIDQRNISKSCRWFPEQIISSLAVENSSEFEDKHNSSSNGVIHSRSFHTVEDYDGMVNKIWLSKSHRVQQSEFHDEGDDGSGTNMDLQVYEFVPNTTHHTEDKDSTIKKMQPPCLHNKYSLDESKIVKEISILSTTPESSIVTPGPKSHFSSFGIKSEEIVPSQKTNVLESAAQGGSTVEKGNKRKAVAKRLESLRIPSNIECPAIASRREWLPTDGIYSPGSYVTPKFGSYSLMNIRNANESNEDSIFNAELVSAFEQCIQKLEAEEENILKQIIEHLEEESDGEMQPQEKTLPCIKGQNPYLQVNEVNDG